MTRRQWLEGTGAGALLGAAGVLAYVKRGRGRAEPMPALPPAPGPDAFRRLYRRDRRGDWQEVGWKLLRPGDRVLALVLHGGELKSLEAWLVGPGAAVGGSDIDHRVVQSCLLVDGWGKS